MGIALDNSNPAQGVVPISAASRGMPGPGNYFYSSDPTTDNNWHASSFHTPSNAPYGVASSGIAQNFWVAGQTAALYNSTNGGFSWPTAQTFPLLVGQKVDFRDICFTDPNHGFITGSDAFGTIRYLVYTKDGGSNWVPVSGVGNNGDIINSVSFVNSTTGWICTANGNVYKLTINYTAGTVTSSSALAMTRVYPSPPSSTPVNPAPASLNKIFALDENNVFTVCDNGNIYAIITPLAVTSVINPVTSLNQVPVGFTGNLVISGTNFQIGSWGGGSGIGSISFPGSGIVVNSVTRNNSSQLTVNVSSTNLPTGTFNARVENIDGTIVDTTTFSVNAVPTITSSLNPASGAQGTSLDVTVTGTGFQSGIAANFGGSDITSSVTTQSPTQLTVHINIAGSATTGSRTVTFTNPDGGQATASFTVNASPTINFISPPSGTQGTNLNLIVTGSGFQDGITANFGAGITNSVTYQSALQLSVNIAIDASAATGQRSITFTNHPDNGSGTAIFTVKSAIVPNPSIVSVTPGSLNQGTSNQNLIVSGSNFESGATATFSGDGITINSTTFNSSSQLTVNISVAANATTGPRSITITNPSGGSDSKNSVLYITAQGIVIINPTITSSDPSTVYRGTTQAIQIMGSSFQNGATVSFNPTGDIVPSSINFMNSNQIDVILTIAPSASLVTRDIIVTNPDGGHGTLANALKISPQSDIADVTSAIFYPNPYNPGSASLGTIQFFITRNALVEIVLVDISGKQIMGFSTNATVGYNKLRWDGTDYNGKRLPNGIILAIFKTDGNLQKQKLKIMLQNK